MVKAKHGGVAGSSWFASDRSAEAGWQPAQRVHRIAVEAHLEVQVVAGGRTGGADPADHLPLAYLLTRTHADGGLVRIAGREALPLVPAVVETGVVAVPAVPAGAQDLARGRGEDRRAAARRDV